LPTNAGPALGDSWAIAAATLPNSSAIIAHFLLIVLPATNATADRPALTIVTRVNVAQTYAMRLR